MTKSKRPGLRRNTRFTWISFRAATPSFFSLNPSSVSDPSPSPCSPSRRPSLFPTFLPSILPCAALPLTMESIDLSRSVGNRDSGHSFPLTLLTYDVGGDFSRAKTEWGNTFRRSAKVAPVSGTVSRTCTASFACLGS